MPWLNTRAAAGHLDLSEPRFLALVRAGKFPRPSYHLGDRSPRWNSEALDRAMDPATASPKRDIGEATNAMVEEIRRENQNRAKGSGGRVGQDIPV